MRRPSEARLEVPIESRDYWYKTLENHQTNWALVDDSSVEGCIAYFFHERSGVFDRMQFVSWPEAESELRANDFGRLRDDPEAERTGAPTPPFYEDVHPHGRIYSSGQFWRRPSESE